MARLCHQVSRWSFLFALVSIGACGGEPRQSPAAVPPPTLEPAFRIRLDTANAFIGSPIAISPSGLLAIAAPIGDTAIVGIYDSTGSVVAALGRHGSGPGELQAISALLFEGDTAIVVADAMEARILTFALSGRLLHQLSGEMFMRPVHAAADSVILLGLSPGGTPQVTMSSLATGGSTVLVGFSDSVLTKHFVEPWEHAQSPMHRPIPVLAADEQLIAIGDAERYRIWLYDRRGRLQAAVTRDLPAPHRSASRVERQIATLSHGPAQLDEARLSRLRDRLASENRPYFDVMRGLAFDREGRLWVGGLDGDSAFADVFGDSAFLGRIPIGCDDYEGNWSVNGNYVALMCVGNRRDGTVLAQVYRIAAGKRSAQAH